MPGTDNARLMLELSGPRETSALVAGLTGTEGVLSVDVVADPQTE